MKLYTPLLLAGVIASTMTLTPRSASAQKAAEVGIGPEFKGPVGLQLYSLRAQFGKDVPGTLDVVKSFGIKYAELAGTYKVPPAEFKAQLESHGIKAISGHFGYDQYRDHLDEVVKE